MKVGELVGKGAEAELYSCKWLNEDAVVKRRVRKGYRIPDLDRRLRRVRTEREAKLLAAAKAAGARVPLVLHVDALRNEIVMSWVKGELLRNSYAKLTYAEKKKVFWEVGYQLAAMHNNGIVHGDSTTSNVMYDSRNVVFIDFGLSEFSSSVEEQATDLLLFKKSVSGEDFKLLLKSYRKHSRGPKAIEERLAEIERRGRYVMRAMAEERRP